jgi:C4-dicarboxylate-specific signal transduction histidine kinase
MRDAGKGGDYEARLRRADGQFRWFLFRTNPLYDDAGTLTQWFGVNIDIDDRKRAEENLRQSQAELARMTRIMTIGELAVSIAHEVNQPLMAIVTNAATCMRWLSNGQLDIPQAQKAVERIERDGLRAGEIIASIRGLARKSLPRMERMNIAYTVQDVLNLMHGELHRRDIDVAAIDSEDAPEVIGDPIQLQQVVLNLIMNSVEAMATPALGSRRLAIDIFSGSDGYAQVVISDSGTGLDPVAGDRVFDAFFTTKQNGMGMGLSICRSIIEAHGGRIWVSQNTPSGSKFHFTVPLAAGIGSNDKTP